MTRWFPLLVLLPPLAMGGPGCSSRGDAPITAETAAYVPLDDTAALAVTTNSPSPSSGGSPLAPTRVGVVRVDEVVRRCHRTRDTWQRLLPVDLGHQTDVKKWEKALAWFEAGGTATAPDPEVNVGPGEGQARTAEDARAMRDVAQARYQAWRRDIERDLRIATHKDLAEALPAIAVALGVDVVVKTHAADLANADPDMVDYEIANAHVLYHGKTVDLTEAAIRAVNEQYDGLREK